MKRRSALALAVAVGLGVALSACSSGTTSAHPASCAVKITNKKAPEVTLWGWSPTDEVAVKQFNKAHNDVQICWTNAGAGQAEYDKFTTAITAKTGAPDVIMLETEVLTSFEIKNALVNLSKYGANAVKSDFAPGTLKDISQGGDIYAIPDDGGPVAMMYRKDIFDKYKLPVPTTWAQYADDAQKLKDAGGPLIGDWPSDTPQFPQALFNQKGAQTFDYSLSDKQSIGIDIDNQPSQDVLNYWNDLVKKKLVGTVGEATTDFTSNVVKGNYATFIAASWEPGHLTGAGIKSGADSPWRVAPLPQWTPTDPQVNWGGSTYAVTTQSTHPKLAAEVAIGLFGDENPTTIGAHFPMHLKAQKASWFTGAKDPFFGNQSANKEVWIPAAQGYKGTSYSPFQSYYYAQLVSQMSKLNDGDTTPDAALATLQKSVSAYAKSQGLTVK